MAGTTENFVGISHILKLDSCTAREFAQLVGSLVSACTGLECGMLYTKLLEREKLLALQYNDTDYGAKMDIPKNIIYDLCWWQKALD